MIRRSYNKKYFIDESIEPREYFVGEPVGEGQYYFDRSEVVADFYITNEKETLRNFGRDHNAKLNSEKAVFSKKFVEECKKDASLYHTLHAAMQMVDDKRDFWLDVADKHFDVSAENWFEKARYNMELMFTSAPIVEACIKAEACSRAHDDLVNLGMYVATACHDDYQENDEPEM